MKSWLDRPAGSWQHERADRWDPGGTRGPVACLWTDTLTDWLLVVVGAVLLTPPNSRSRLMPFRIPALGALRNWSFRRRPRPRAVIEVLSGMRDELEAGAALRAAFERAVETAADPAVCANSLAVCRMGGDVTAALRQDGREQPLLLSLAALWQVSEGSGAALAVALDRLVAGAEQASRVRREVAAQLAGPRSTVRVLALLPLIGVGMGLLMGADPIGFLITTPWGWGCLAGALLLEGVGVFWMRGLVRSIESRL